MDFSGLFSAEMLSCAGVLLGGIATFYSIRGVGKWRTLAEQYPVRQSFQGDWLTLDWFRVLAGVVTVCTYTGRSAKIGTTKEYFYLSVPLAALMPPLQIPWTSIRNPRKKKNVLLFEIDELTIELADKLFPQEILTRLGIRQQP